MSTCFLHVPDPDDQPFDDDEPNKPIAPGDRWCSLWAPREPGGPRLPCHPSIEGTADEWLLIAGAIEAGAPRAFGRVAFAPAAGGGELWSPHNSTGDRDHVRLTTAELVELAADVRAKLATPDRDLKPDNAAPAHPMRYYCPRYPTHHHDDSPDGFGPCSWSGSDTRDDVTCPECPSCGARVVDRDRPRPVGDGPVGWPDFKAPPPNPDVTTSAPRPTPIADQPPCRCQLCAPSTNLDDVRACVAAAEQAAASPPGEHDLASLYAVAGYTRSMCDEIERLRARPAVDRADITAALETFRLAAIAEHAASTDRGESIGAVRAAVVTLQDARDAVFAAVAPPAIPADLRELLEALVAKADAMSPDYRHDWDRDSSQFACAVDALIAWTRAHAGATPAPLTDDELASMWRLRIGTSPSPNGMTLMRTIRDHAGGGR